jgi:reductive dehalogenase
LIITQALIGLSFLWSCILEREKRATVFAALQLILMLGVVLLILFLHSTGFFHTIPGIVLLISGLLISSIVLYMFLRKSGVNQTAFEGTNGLVVGEPEKHDERSVVFARNRSLQPDSEQYRRYYEKHPEKKDFDDKRRQAGGPLGHPGSIDRPDGDANTAAAFASITIPMHLSGSSAVKPQQITLMKGKRFDLSPEEATKKVKGYASQIGADLVGVTELNQRWVYSHRGEIFHDNWEDWGSEIHVDHPYAIVMAVEMSFDLVGSAPHTPTLVESMKNYAKGAYLTTQLAAFIANLGYSATASHFRHYELVLPPLAVDAGLGEVGRLGYLITKEFGPRIRLCAITTDLPLVPDKPVDIGVKDFCRVCKKCAVCCPSRSIPLGDPREVNGSVRWKLNEETCFEYWGKIGTDCNICMRVCPWSHARTLPHKLIVELVSRNRLSRRMFTFLDDVFYGKKPKFKEGPDWSLFHS